MGTCRDSAPDGIHPARSDTASDCAYHRAIRRFVSSTASRERAKARRSGSGVEIDTRAPGPRPTYVRANAPAIPVAADGSDVHVAVPRRTRGAAWAAFAAEERARDTIGRDLTNRAVADGLASASLALSQEVDAILYGGEGSAR